MASETQVIETEVCVGPERWPIEVRALVASLGVQNQYLEKDRRRHPRKPFTVQSVLWFKDGASAVQRETIYTRDVSKRTLALVGRVFLKGGQSVVLDLPDASGRVGRFQGHVRRCRQITGGWFDCLVELAGNAKLGR